jgi:hypothetical protein
MEMLAILATLAALCLSLAGAAKVIGDRFNI